MNFHLTNRINNNNILLVINNKMNILRMPKKHFYNINEIYNNYVYDFVDINNIDDIEIEFYEKIIIDQYSLPIDNLHKKTIKYDINKIINILKKAKKIYMMTEDMDSNTYNDYSEIKKLLNNTNVYSLITYYNNQMLKKMLRLKDGLLFYHLPHHINTNIYKDYNSKKKIDILFYGSKTKSLYPMRIKLWIILFYKLSKKYNVKIIKHPGYNNYDNNKCGIQLANIINQSWITIATTSIFNRTLAKYFEISACNSTILGTTNEFIDKIWGTNIIKINENMNDNEIIQIIDINLKNKNKLNNMSKNMYNIIQNNYNNDKYSIKFNKLIKKNI
jgi:hypothetical protein